MNALYEWLKDKRSHLFILNMVLVVCFLILSVVNFQSVDMKATTTNQDVVRLFGSLCSLYLAYYFLKGD